jgi:hypothetical protein
MKTLVLFLSVFLADSVLSQSYFVVGDGGINVTSSTGAYITSENLIYSGNGTLSIQDDLTISGPINAQGSKFSIGSNVVNITGNLTSSGIVEIGEGTLDCDGTYDVSNGNTTFVGAGNLKLSSSVTSFGTITQGSGKITYDGGDQTVLTLNGNGTSGSYENLEIAGTGTKTLAGSSDIYGDLILTSGSFDLNGKTIYAKNDILTTSGQIIASSGSNITYNNSGSHALSGVNSENITIKTLTTGGSVTSTGDITCGSIDMSSGTKTFTLDGETINIEDDIIVTAGTLNITGGIVNINSNSGSSCLIEGGTLDIDGGVLTVGSTTLADLNFDSGVIDISGGTLNVVDQFDMSGGTLNQSGGILNVKSYVGSSEGSSAENKFDITAGTINFTGGTLNLLGQVSSSTKTAMSIASGVSLTANTSHTTVVESNNSSSNDEDIYLDLNGKSLGNLTINLGGHETYLNSNLNVLGTLTLTDGVVETIGNTLYLGSNSNNATISGGSSTSYVIAYDNNGTIGKVVHYINSNSIYNFPVGDASNYAPVELEFVSGAYSNAEVECYTMGRKVDGLSDNIETHINRSWSVEPTGVTNPSYNINYIYNSGEWVGDQFFDLVPIKISNGVWYRPVNSVISDGIAQGSCNHNTNENRLTWSGLSTFSLFGAAGGGSTLPVELLSFSANCSGTQNLISWQTASEYNSSYFDLEYSRDGLYWQSLHQTEAAVFSNELVEYSYLHENGSTEDHYYKLYQYDIDGEFEQFGPIYISCQPNLTTEIKTYPTPSSDAFYVYIKEYNQTGNAVLEVIDIKGEVAFKEKIQLEDGITIFPIRKDLAPGIYTVRVKCKGEILGNTRQVIH